MPVYAPRLSAEEVDARLRQSLRELRAAEQNSFLWFAEIMNRRLYRSLGYSTVQQYALERLDFSRSKVAYFVRLASVIKDLPKLHTAMIRSEIGWSKAVLLVRVATRSNEKQWIDVARACGRRELARRVKVAQGAASGGKGTDLFAATAESPDKIRSASPAVSACVDPDRATHRTSACAPPGPEVGPPVVAKAATRPTNHAPPCVPEEAEAGSPGATPREAVPSAATEVRLRLTPAQRGQYEALLEKARSLGARGGNPELVLEALSLLVSDLKSTGSDRRKRLKETAPSNRLDADSAKKRAQSRDSSMIPRGGTRFRTHQPIYQVYVRTCEECDRGWMETNAEPRVLDVATLRAVLCDARVSRPGEPNRHSIPPRLRREAPERDRYRCRAGGCGSHRFLHVHHLHAQEDGGKHTLENLITLCRPCHTLVHSLRGGELALRTKTMEPFAASGVTV